MLREAVATVDEFALIIPLAATTVQVVDASCCLIGGLPIALRNKLSGGIVEANCPMPRLTLNINPHHEAELTAATSLSPRLSGR